MPRDAEMSTFIVYQMGWSMTRTSFSGISWNVTVSASCWVSLSPCVGWDHIHTGGNAGVVDISIHPPRVGWDPMAWRWSSPPTISIHPPRVGWDSRSNRQTPIKGWLLLTKSLKDYDNTKPYMRKNQWYSNNIIPNVICFRDILSAILLYRKR